jgi:hypothetical protein
VIRTLLASTLLALFLSASIALSDGLKTQQVVVTGIGDSPQSAAQNAAENALTQVVGSFVDTETILKKNTEIQNGVKEQSKQINTQTREYSQGSIKQFDIISSEQQGALYKVTASVVVRIEDFKAYIKKVAEGEVAVQEGLFVQMSTDQNNAASAKDFIFSQFLPQVISGQVEELQIGSPIPFKESGMQAYFDSGYRPSCEDGVAFGLANACSDSRDFQAWKSGAEQLAGHIQPNCGSFDQSRTVVLPMEIRLNSNFKDNLKKTLDSIAFKKSVFHGGAREYGMQCYQISQDSLCVALSKSEYSSGVELYSLNNIGYDDAGRLLSDVFKSMSKVGFDLSILGANDVNLASIQLVSNGAQPFLASCSFGESQNSALKGVLIGNPHLVAKTEASLAFFDSSSTKIVLELDSEILKQAQSVSVRYHQ